MSGGDGFGVTDVSDLIVEEKVGLEGVEELALFGAGEKKHFVHFHAPLHQGADGALVGGRAARGDQGDADLDGGGFGQALAQVVQRL